MKEIYPSCESLAAQGRPKRGRPLCFRALSRLVLSALSLVFVLSIAVSSAHPEPPAAPGVHAWKVGASYQYTLKVVQSGQVRIGERTRRVSTQLTGVMELTAFAVPSSENIRLRVRIKRASTRRTAGGEALEGNALEVELERMEASWIVTPRGETVNFLMASRGAGSGSAMLLLRDVVLEALPVFPGEEALVQGESWKSERRSKEGSALTTRVAQVWTVNAVEGRRLELGVRLNASFVTEAKGEQGALASTGSASGWGEATLTDGVVDKLSIETRQRSTGGPSEGKRGLGQDLTMKVNLERLTQ